MFVHTVFFWLERKLTAEQVREFRGGLETLRGIGTASACHIGRPAKTNRPVVDRTYDFALTVIFADQAGHDAYQNDPVHLAFVKNFSPYWIRVAVYDAE